MPARTCFAMVSVAASTALRSGPPSSDSGVGTQMTSVPAPSVSSPITEGSVVARKPDSRIRATSWSETSSMRERPWDSASTTAASRSSPATWSPLAHASCANGKPT